MSDRKSSIKHLKNVDISYACWYFKIMDSYSLCTFEKHIEKRNYSADLNRFFTDFVFDEAIKIKFSCDNKSFESVYVTPIKIVYEILLNSWISEDMKTDLTILLNDQIIEYVNHSLEECDITDDIHTTNKYSFIKWNINKVNNTFSEYPHLVNSILKEYATSTYKNHIKINNAYSANYSNENKPSIDDVNMSFFQSTEVLARIIFSEEEINNIKSRLVSNAIRPTAKVI